MKWKKLLSGTLAMMLAVSPLAQAAPLTVRAAETGSIYEVCAPSEDLKIQFWLDEAGAPWYQVERNGAELIQDAKLGLNTSLGALNSGLELIGEPVETSGDTTWKPVVGEQSEIRDRYNETSFTLSQKETGLEFEIVMRAYDGGVAFQYVLPEIPEESTSYTISDEYTQFVFPAGVKASLHVGGNQTVPKKYAVESFPSGSIRRPATFEYADGQALTICEGNLDNFSTMVMAKSGTARALEANYDGTVTVDGEDGPAATPWRVLVTGGSVTELLENDTIVQNLNEPADEDTYKFSEWLEPGTCVRATRGLNNDAIKTVIDLASAHGIRYVLLDSGWYGPEYDKNADPRLDPAALNQENEKDAILLEKYFATEGGYNNTGEGVFNTNGVGFNQYGSLGDGGSMQVNVDIPALCAYGKEKNVGLVLYVNGVFFPDSSGRDRFTADELFAYYEKWGVAGVKPGFVNCRTQKNEQHMEEVIEAAAKHKLVLTIHDEYVPAGLERTYPNLMMTEGILGDEGIGKNSPQAAEDITTIFTRNVQGPADHTFSYPGKATKVYALASPILFRSGMSVLYWYTDPGKIPAQDEGKMNIWDDMPTTWEESLFLEGSLYEYATTARRTAEDVWYVGSLSAITRRLELPLDFLEENVTYVADIYADGIDADPYAGWTTSATSAKGKQTIDYRQYLVTSETTLERDLEYGFGYAAVLTKATEEDTAAYSAYNVYRQELELELLRAEEIVESSYTTESWETFTAAKTAAEEMAANGAATDEQLETAMSDLKAAAAALVSTESLEKAIAGTIYYTSYHYTKESFAALEEAVAEAQALLDGGSFTQAQLDEAEAAIASAVEGLEDDPNKTLKSTVYLDELDYDTTNSYAHAGAIKKKVDYYGSSLSLMIDGTEQIFERGMMTHAQSEVYYNIEGKGFEIFEAYVGVDTIKASQGNIIFKVYGDDVLLYESKASGTGSQNAQHFSIPVATVKELRIEANMAGSNDGDHGVWADAKFLTYRDPDAYLEGITVDGEELRNFDKNVFEYFCKAEAGQIPAVDVIPAEDDVVYEIIEAEEVPGCTEIVVTKRDGSTMTYCIYMLPTQDSDYLSNLPSDLITKNTLYGFTKDVAQGGLQLALTDADGSTMITFKKGIGTHATTASDSMIVYDILGRDYDLFEGYVGISYLKNDNRSKINFKIYVNDETTPRFESGAMTYRAPAIFYSVDVSDAETLTLVADPCGDQSADHGCWCDAKFLKYTGIQKVSGTVDVANTGLAPAGISVELYKVTADAAEQLVETALTNENGEYLFEKVLAGNYVVKIPQGENYFEESAEISVAEEAVVQNLTLTAPEYEISVVQPAEALVTAEASKAVKGQKIAVYVRDIAAGKKVTEVRVQAEDGTMLAVTSAESHYTFVMPGQDVTIQVILGEDAAYEEALAAAQQIDEKILSVGEVTLEKKAQIEEIRAEYENLSDAAKALVEQLEQLEHCERTLEALEIQEAVETAKAAAEEAQAKAEAAQAEAEAAQAAAEAAKAAAEEAQASTAEDKQAAAEAQAAAEEAQAEAEAAKTAAETAKAEAEAAQAAAEAAQAAAEENNAEAAENAKKAAEEALKAAEEAKKAAESANLVADYAAQVAQAQAKAQEAQAKAEAAQAEAEKAAEEAKKAQEAAELATAKQTVILEMTLFVSGIDTTKMSQSQKEQYEAAVNDAIAAVNAAADEAALEGIVDELKEKTAEIQNSSVEMRFVDVSDSDWFYYAVEYVASHDIMTGTDEIHFSPEKSLTRAQFATILYRIEGKPETVTEKSFYDVNQGDWFRDAVLWAAEEGIVSGYEAKGTFEPNKAVTREQMAAMMYRYAEYLGEDTTVRGDLEAYKDAENVSAYAEEAMQWATGVGIITGKNGIFLDPKGTTTRGAAASVVQRFMEAYTE